MKRTGTISMMVMLVLMYAFLIGCSTRPTAVVDKKWTYLYNLGSHLAKIDEATNKVIRDIRIATSNDDFSETLVKMDITYLQLCILNQPMSKSEQPYDLTVIEDFKQMHADIETIKATIYSATQAATAAIEERNQSKFNTNMDLIVKGQGLLAQEQKKIRELMKPMAPQQT